jgi:hypothetical protein
VAASIWLQAWLWPAAPTTGGIALDLEGVVRAHLGALVVANGQPTRKVVAELIGHGGVKLQVDQEGLLVWKNTGMMFVTLGARKAKLARSGQQLHTVVSSIRTFSPIGTFRNIQPHMNIKQRLAPYERSAPFSPIETTVTS